jgi:short-subunit dehydrogenase
MDLRDANVLVTGASSGIGEATAIAFARRGARAILVARRKDRLDALAARIERAGGRAISWTCDVTDLAAVEKLPGLVMELTGRPVDVLVNNAGIAGGGSFLELSHERIDEVVRVNLLGVMHVTRVFLPGMLSRETGHVINVASLAGRFAAPGAAVYTATKHGVVAFSESLDVSTRRRGVLVTAVNPGYVPTEGFPATNRPSLLTLTPERVADAIVKVAREDISPEYSVPRWAAALQAFRILTPPLYRWGLGVADRQQQRRNDPG